jgi:nucleoside-diphosphate-sugar epimerase
LASLRAWLAIGPEGQIVAAVAEIISAMQAAAPPRRQDLTTEMTGELQSLTETLIAAKPDAIKEYRRFAAIGARRLAVDEAGLSDWLRGKSVLVTGGTGCLGSILLRQLTRFSPARLVSVTRGHASTWPRVPVAEYLRADVADRGRLRDIIREIRPDVIFHMAAQRDPGRAETDTELTVRTNVFGTRNVAELATELGVPHVIAATTGKAMRPYSREIYTATKRIAEWMMARAAARSDCALTAVRFTHVVDNSIVYQRMISWARSGILRLHDPGTMFYAQAGLESAQLMLQAGLRSQAGGLRICAVSDLGWPVSLIDLAVGLLQETGSASPIYFSGHDAGYESVPFPGLYDPATAADASPLFSAFEVASAEPEAIASVDAHTAAYDFELVPEDTVAWLEDTTMTGTAESVRGALDTLAWHLLDSSLAAAPARALARAVRFTEPYEERLSCDHARMLAALRWWRDGGGAPSTSSRLASPAAAGP